MMAIKYENYKTPIPYIRAIMQILKLDIFPPDKFLELGCSEKAPFCKVAKEFWPNVVTYAIDIRKFKKPKHVDKIKCKCDVTSLEHTGDSFDLIMMNPPFSLSDDFLRAAMSLLRYHGTVIMLNRVQWLGGKKRNLGIHSEYSPRALYYIPDRISFTEDNHTDYWDCAWFFYGRSKRKGCEFNLLSTMKV